MTHAENQWVLTLVAIENPRNRGIATLNGTITSMLRRLGITSGNPGDREAKAKRGQRQREATDKLKDVPDVDAFDRSSLM